MKIVTIVGARPQFIKSLPVSRALQAQRIEELVLHTGQHYDERMSQIFYDQLHLSKPVSNLNTGSGSHAVQTAKMLTGIEDFLLTHRPNAIVLYGDTNSTLAGALAASKLRVPIAHVEAGLRSFDRNMPEEINRELTDKISDWLFTPTRQAGLNLRNEGISADKIHEVGDVMYDAYLQCAQEAVPLMRALNPKLPASFILLTIHRAENTDIATKLEHIAEAIIGVSRQIPIVFPIHPRTLKALSNTSASLNEAPGIFLIEPQGYLEMLALIARCEMVVTDSGGLQKEAYFARKPCVTLRTSTEWVELVDSGWNILVAPEPEIDIAQTILGRLGTMGDAVTLYGGGRASAEIAEMMLKCQ